RGRQRSELPGYGAGALPRRLGAAAGTRMPAVDRYGPGTGGSRTGNGCHPWMAARNMRNETMGFKQVGLLFGCVMLVAGCAGTGGYAPVVDSGRPVSNEDMQTGAGVRGQGQPAIVQPSPQQDDGGVIVMVPDGMGGSSAV